MSYGHPAPVVNNLRKRDKIFNRLKPFFLLVYSLVRKFVSLFVRTCFDGGKNNEKKHCLMFVRQTANSDERKKMMILNRQNHYKENNL